MAKKTAVRVDADRFMKALRDTDSKSKNPTEILASLGFPSPLVVRGAENFRLKRLVQWLLGTAFGNLGLGVTSFFGNELNSKASLPAFASALQNLSLFSPAQAVVLYNADAVKAAQAAALAEHIARAPFTLVVLVANSSAKAAPLLDKLSESSTIEIAPLKGAILLRWIKKEFQSLGVAVEDSAAALLAGANEDDTEGLLQQILNLALVTDAGGAVTEALVKQHVSRAREQTSFELVNQIAARNLAATQQITNDLLTQGLAPLQINAFVGRAYRMLLAQNADKNSGGQSPSLPSDLTQPWMLSKLSAARRRFSPERLTAGIATCAELDLTLKSSRLDPELSLSLALLKLARFDSLNNGQ